MVLTKRELLRKLIHVISSMILVVLIYFGFVSKYALLVFSIIFLGFSFYIKSNKDSVFVRYFNLFDKEQHAKTIPLKSAILGLFSIVLCLFLFKTSTVLASIMILGLGDGLSPLGQYTRKIKHPFHDKKFLEGVLLGIIFATLGASLFVPLGVAFITSSIAMLVESTEKIEHLRLDDNFLIPLVSCFVLKFIFGL